MLVDGPEEGSDHQDSDTEEEMSVIGSRTPSITAPIVRKESTELREPSRVITPRHLEPMRDRNSFDNIENKETKQDEDVKKERVPPEPDKLPLKPKHVDAESNTTNSGRLLTFPHCAKFVGHYFF